MISWLVRWALWPSIHLIYSWGRRIDFVNQFSLRDSWDFWPVCFLSLNKPPHINCSILWNFSPGQNQLWRNEDCYTIRFYTKENPPVCIYTVDERWCPQCNQELSSIGTYILPIIFSNVSLSAQIPWFVQGSEHSIIQKEQFFGYAVKAGLSCLSPLI